MSDPAILPIGNRLGKMGLTPQKAECYHKTKRELSSSLISPAGISQESRALYGNSATPMSLKQRPPARATRTGYFLSGELYAPISGSIMIRPQYSQTMIFFRSLTSSCF